MAGSLNKVILIGHLGKDPDIRSTSSGNPVASLSLATSESWKDASGNKQERTEWHRIVIFGKLAEIAEKYARKGSKILVEGQLATRKWQAQDGSDRYTTEVVLRGFNGNLQLLDRRDSNSPPPPDEGDYRADNHTPTRQDELDDEIPF